MIVWLASYPRSGNTLLRILLRQAFGLETFSIHPKGDDRDFGDDEWIRDVVGHVSEQDPEQLLKIAADSKDLVPIKTHQGPSDDSPAIYVVRDGRAATISFYHYSQDRNQAVALSQLIDGVPFCGSWSSHFRAWSPLSRPNTLLLRFEEMVADTQDAINRISEFLNIRPTGKYDLSFDQLHARSPEFFRSGSNSSNISELSDHAGRFLVRHGEVMAELGYIGREEQLRSLEQYALELERQTTTPDTLVGMRDSLRFISARMEVLEGASYERFLATMDAIRHVDHRIDDILRIDHVPESAAEVKPDPK
jgi:hypothetical protein